LRCSVTKRDVELSRTIYRNLLDKAAVLETGFLTYKDVGDGVGVFYRSLTGPLCYIQDRCLERGWPTLTVWVVKKSRGLPGFGCDVVEPTDVQRTAAETKNVAWPAAPWW
jgi:hypothetical protein